MEVFKEFRFEAAHRLPNVPPSHKCYGLHGHSFRIRVYVAGPVSPETGFVVDFAEIKQGMTPLLEELDHQLLNDIDGLQNPTTENLARWVWRRLSGTLHSLSRLEVWETPTSGCVYSGEDD